MANEILPVTIYLGVPLLVGLGMLALVFFRARQRRIELTSMRPQVERLLAQLSLSPPEARWGAVVHRDGILIGSFPNSPGREERLAWTAASALHLSDRLGSELEMGKLRYLLFAGETQNLLISALNHEFMLVFGLAPEVELAGFFETLQPVLPALRDLLDLKPAPAPATEGIPPSPEGLEGGS
jgi:predicted regulator of Ras-like GTPase activity (Roadblock/LC7/MglB family)